jgi:general L-amino acid transport system permease protein
MAADAREGIAPTKPPIWNDRRYRAVFYQVLVLAGVLLAGAYIVNNTLNNLESRGIASGFGFLSKTAGFSIDVHLIDYKEENSYGRAFVVSLINTLLVAAVGIVITTILGFLVGIARLSPNWLISKLATVYIELLRNIPLLLQIFFWYFAVLRILPSPRQSHVAFDGIFLNIRGLFTPKPIFEQGFSTIVIAFFVAVVGAFFMVRWARKRQEETGKQFPKFLASAALLLSFPIVAAVFSGFPLSWEIPKLVGFNFTGGIRMIPEFVALVFALSTYTASFIAEIVRAGILSVSQGQTEAASALGLRRSQTLRLIIIPQALRVIIPPLTSQYLNLTKNSSLAAAIAYPDIVLVFAGTALMQTGQAVEIIAITMAVYLTISLVISGLMNWYNKHMALVER